jgi:hypothetical protein
MNKKIITIFMMFLFLIVGAFAENTVYKLSENITIDRPCYNLFLCDWCSIGTTCSLTVTSPSNNIIIDNQPMLNQGSHFTYLMQNVNELGTYKGDMNCIDNGVGGVNSFLFDITQSGTPNNITSTILNAVLFIIVSLLFVVSLIVTFSIPSDNKRDENGFITDINYMIWVKLLFGAITYILLWVLCWFGVSLSSNFLGIPELGSFFTSMLTVVKYGFFVILPLFAVAGFLIIIKNKKIEKMLERGDTELR